MHLHHLFSLPPAIIALCATSSVVAAQADSHQQQWPHNVPKHLKYFPEDEVHAKRGLSVAQRLQHEKPIGVKKMSLDEGEMFMLDNWIFASESQQQSRRSDSDNLGNLTVQAVSPLRPLAQSDWLARMHIRDVLLKRQFKCPEGTNSCESIGAPDVCCGTGSNCINTSGSSDAGNVGCCPKGQTCAGNVNCDTASGYSSCPGSPNGGCCLPGFKCQGVGCVLEATSTTFIPPSSTSSTVAPPAPTTSAAPTSTTPSPSSTTPPPTSSSSRTAYTCSTGWFSCPASLGGGCCQNGRTCATGASCIGDTPTSTRAPDAPIRPTSGTTTAAQATSADVCPQGFYVCSAYYPSGCCRVGRDCQTTGSSCVLPTGTVVDTNGVTVVAPTTNAGSCPSAWYSCAASAGGNCCPQGYACGEQQCTATASGQAGTTEKATPSSSSSSKASFVTAFPIAVSLFAAGAIGVAMVVL
ncbi:hypothetical protein GGP41_003506 [Bipolaris sorokiniana]|uniref:GPI anchored protein n=2 Tax=Cochliobolus sativus TaxID=45130 RepID=A0A8H6DTA0_COCSA|nr:uncharacterized protein COCSADRAFT_38567 [Bipolaris sorokiniana ND90Pr]EMD62694.1 hypothetical protein COCSADRAFT_38567 [Bipolaris sorokiniana ND90Pr]KAF5847217.1 hypothetical protein GGP41_003506 [Bipolaris sorokiniana]